MIESVRPGIVIVGTAHVSATSVREVEEAIRTHRPSRVLVELDAARRKALEDPEAWQQTDIFRVLREKKQHLFLLQLYLAAMQAQMGRQTGVPPGGEMLRAMQVADEVGAEVVLIDREISVTLKRGFGAMGFWAKLRLAWHVMEHLLPGGDDTPVDVDDILESDAITKMTDQFARFAPEVKVALIDERDAYMASHIQEQWGLAEAEVLQRQAKSANVGSPLPPDPTAAPAALPTTEHAGGLVAVVGAGHLAGIRRHLGAPAAIPARDTLTSVPRKRLSVAKVSAVLLPLVVGAFVVWFVLQGQWDLIKSAIVVWIVTHFVLAGLGAALALGHPLAILTGAAAAPFTSVVPVVKSGWLAGLVQAKVRSPKVKDFQDIKLIDSFGQFWRNGVVRILTVTSLTILGSWVAHVVSITWIASRSGLP